MLIYLIVMFLLGLLCTEGILLESLSQNLQVYKTKWSLIFFFHYFNKIKCLLLV